MKLLKSQTGFSPLHVLFVLVIIGIVGFAGWKVYDSKEQTEKSLDSAVASSEVSKPDVPKSQIPEGFVEYESKDLGFKFAYPKEWGGVKFAEDKCKLEGACAGWQGNIIFDATAAESAIPWIQLFSDDAYTNKDGSRIFTKGYKLEQGKIYSNYDKQVIPEAVVMSGALGEYAFFDAKAETEFRESKTPLMYAGVNLSGNTKYKGLQVFTGRWQVNKEKFLEFMDTFQVLK